MKTLEWGKPVGGWRLSASLDKDVFKTGEPIILSIVFENASEKKQAYGAQGKEFDHDLNCRSASGEAPLTLYGKRMKDNRGRGRYVDGELAPGQNLVSEIALSRHLDLTLAGKYSLTVVREVFPHEGRNEPVVVSNTCSFEIQD